MTESELENRFGKESVGVGGIGNYYGGLCVAEISGKFYWGIENWDGMYAEEIPRSLYDQIIAFNKD